MANPKGGGILILISKNVAFKQITNIKSSNISVELCGLCLNNIKPELDICARPHSHTRSVGSNCSKY